MASWGVPVLHPIAGSLDDDGLGAVQGPIQHGGGDGMCSQGKESNEPDILARKAVAMLFRGCDYRVAGTSVRAC